LASLFVFAFLAINLDAKVIPLPALAPISLQPLPPKEQHVDENSPNLIPLTVFDPPGNPLHSIKLTNKLKTAKNSKSPLFGRWDAHDPGYYTDAFARSLIFPLSAAAYSDDPSLCLKNRFKNATLSKSVRTICDTGDKDEACAGFTALAHYEKAIIISFRGTNGFFQLLNEVNHVVLKEKKPSPIGGLVAYYFHTVFQQIWDAGLKDDVDRLLKEYPTYEIWVTGHSLGGSVASIAATWILNEYNLENERIKLVTFGQPRTGDSEFALSHNMKLPRSYRVTHHRDMVPHVPPEKFESYFHHQSEIWYPKAMSQNSLFVVCNDGESNECSDKNWIDTSISDHLNYFETSVSVYGVGGCAAKL